MAESTMNSNPNAGSGGGFRIHPAMIVGVLIALAVVGAVVYDVINMVSGNTA